MYHVITQDPLRMLITLLLTLTPVISVCAEEAENAWADFNEI
jgi:hypothetical protein